MIGCWGWLRSAVIEEQRIEWMNHIEEQQGQVPSADDIRRWYDEKPEGVLLRAKGTAATALQTYSDLVAREALEAEGRKIADGIIVDEIRMARRFFPQFGISVAGGFVSAFLFAAVLAILAIIVLYGPSPVKLGTELLGNQVQEKVDGKTQTKSGRAQ